ncbi:hypothetical protein KCP76_02925 [Salmonella enterica subsp. enterica serovar Weltevreden]|nr:hypothetical protein KCP76_02925 [Salmonella enterica subsp. enterica serovar Weltevreden]
MECGVIRISPGICGSGARRHPEWSGLNYLAEFVVQLWYNPGRFNNKTDRKLRHEVQVAAS